MSNWISKFVIWCLAKPVPPEIRASLLKITKDEDKSLIIKMMDEPWNITDEEQMKIEKITAERDKNIIQPIIERAKSMVGAHTYSSPGC